MLHWLIVDPTFLGGGTTLHSGCNILAKNMHGNGSLWRLDSHETPGGDPGIDDVNTAATVSCHEIIKSHMNSMYTQKIDTDASEKNTRDSSVLDVTVVCVYK